MKGPYRLQSPVGGAILENVGIFSRQGIVGGIEVLKFLYFYMFKCKVHFNQYNSFFCIYE
jgi:hypothetical protein